MILPFNRLDSKFYAFTLHISFPHVFDSQYVINIVKTMPKMLYKNLSIPYF